MAQWLLLRRTYSTRRRAIRQACDVTALLT
jgi:hypothetical protein